MTNIENALIWLYVKTWGKFGEHIIEKDLWKFTGRDLETAIMGLAYPRKRKSNEKEKNRTSSSWGDVLAKFPKPNFRDRSVKFLYVMVYQHKIRKFE